MQKHSKTSNVPFSSDPGSFCTKEEDDMSEKNNILPEITPGDRHPDYKGEIAALLRGNLAPGQLRKKLEDYHERDIAGALELRRRDERCRLYALLDGYNVRILSGHSHNNYTTTISETIEENTLGAVMGAYWNGEELCNDGSPRGYAVYEIEGNRIRNWYYKGTAFPREYQMYLYGPGEAVSEKYRDGLILNIFNWHTTWTVEVQEDNAGWVTLPSDSNLRYEMDRRAYDFMFGDTKPEHRPTAEPESNNDHMFYYKPASESWGTVTVRASDPYGNVYTESIRNE